MNTVKVGDAFELKAYELIQQAIKENKFGIAPQFAQVFRKKKYYSHDREANVIVDLSIEIWPPEAKRFSIVYIIECKGYARKNVPVDEIEEFMTKLDQISNYGYNVKGVFITNTSFQEGALKMGEKKGLMMIQVVSGNALNIILHKSQRDTAKDENDSDNGIEKFLYSLFDLNSVQGLRRLSKFDIVREVEELTIKIYGCYKSDEPSIDFKKLIAFLKKEYRAKFDFRKNLLTVRGKKIYGHFDAKKRKIYIDNSIVNTLRFNFMLAHEIGHLILHDKLKINQQVYNQFKDSEFDIELQKHVLDNHKNWIEWQANYFAACLVMPKVSFLIHLINIQLYLGISKVGYLYFDNQKINKADFTKTITYLSEGFKTTRQSVMYRLQEYGLIFNPQQGQMFYPIQGIKQFKKSFELSA